MPAHPGSPAQSSGAIVVVCIYLVLLLGYNELFVKVTNFNLPHVHLAPQWGMNPFKFRKGLWQQKISLWAIVWHYLCYPMFSHFSRTPTCDEQRDGQMDRQRDGHMTTAYAMLV